MAATAHEDIFTPNRISHANLFGEKPLLDSLTTDGLVSITDIPGFRQVKETTLKHLHECLLDSQKEEKDSVFEAVLNDGTVRRTIASATIPGLGAQPFPNDSSSSQKCQAFQEKLKEFRSTVDKVTSAFANQLSEELDQSLKMPLMNTKDGEYSFDGVKDVVNNGEHLEHFHSYEKKEKDHQDTIELHTDQGLFIVFTPGLYHNKEEGLSVSKGFYIETAKGDTAMVDFSPQDDLIFMLGDGVNQYINPKLRSDDEGVRKLRATPHYVTLDDKEDARAWFGRMILPPSDAYDANSDKTYGEVRRLLSKNENVPNGLGCSSIHQRALDASRALDAPPPGEEADEGCPEGTFQCWFRCMDIPEGESIETCTDENDPDLAIKCINPRGQVSWEGKTHGDYYPKCTRSTANITAYPPLPSEDPFNYPQDEDVCSASAWSDYLEEAAEDYDFVYDLSNDKTAAKFFWSIVDGDMIKGRLSFNGLFGWIAFGFANTAPDAKKNGMNGAQILMATPGIDYSPVTGFDISNGEAGFRVAEYVIDHSASSFRHWDEPVGQVISPKSSEQAYASVEADECFTTLEFTMDSIHETQFDISGIQKMIWGANGDDYFAGYHGRGHRAVFDVEWKTGEAGEPGSLGEVGTLGDESGTMSDESSSSTAAAALSLAATTFLALALS